MKACFASTIVRSVVISISKCRPVKNLSMPFNLAIAAHTTFKTVSADHADIFIRAEYSPGEYRALLLTDATNFRTTHIIRILDAR